MRRQAKAATGGSTRTRRAALPIGAFAAIAVALALVAALASAAVPTATTGSASNIQKTTATLNGTVNPQNALLEECKFDYGTTTSYGQTTSCDLTPAEIGEGTSAVAVKADVAGLTIGTTYHFRLVAKNAEGTSNGADQTFKTLSAPVVETWSTDVVYSEGTLNTGINPEGFATTYKFQWGTTAAYGSETEAANAGSDKMVHNFSRALEGLAAGTTYHYRVVATNANGTTETPDRTFTTYAREMLDTACPNQVYRTGPGAQLSDCRAYEMVSPIDKSNGDVAWLVEGSSENAAYNQSSLDGDKLTYSSYKAFGDALSAPYTSQYIATRHAGKGWSTHSINPPEEKGFLFSPSFVSREYRAFSADLSTSWLMPESGVSLAPGAAEGRMNIYKRNNLDDSYQTLTIGPREAEIHGGLQVGFQGSSADGSHAIFVANEKLTPEAPLINENKHQLYEWVNGTLRLVSIMPNGNPYPDSSTAGRPQFQYPFTTREANLENAISDDGSRIFWTTRTGSVSGQIFVRVDGTETVPVSETVTSGQSVFWTASSDGSKAVFSVGQEGSGDLYEVDVDTETPTLIANDALGVAGAGEDASYIYFASEEALDAGATAGQPNLYVYHESSATFVATLAPQDLASAPSAVHSQPTKRNTRVSPDGHQLIFMSNAPLTGYDNTDADSGKAVSEVYRYDVISDQLNCISCNPSGARPSGSQLMPLGPNTVFVGGPEVAAWIPTWTSSLYTPRTVTDDGNRVFFHSFDSMVPSDSNGAQDVYQWEAPGTGSCTEAHPSFSEQNKGCISLISSGESQTDSEFLDASWNGNDVFFRTASSLLPQDPRLIDAYDARVNGGLPTPPAPPTPCVGDSCQSATEAPHDPTPASAAFRGGGNVTSLRASCVQRARIAARLSRKAKQLRHNAKRIARNAHNARRARIIRRKASSVAKRAKRSSRGARRCRRANRGTPR